MHILSKTNVKAAATIALLSIGIASAQFYTPTDARVNALAGAHVSDISGVYRYPVLMTGYANHVQANWGGAGQGFIGIKSVSDMFSFGVLANQGPVAEALTTATTNQLDGYNWTTALGQPDFDGQVVIPHLLLGFDLGALAIGADVFFEYAGYSASAKAGGDTYENSGSYANPGVRLSGKFDAGAANIMAKFGIGIPMMNAEGLSGSDKLSLDEGLYLEMGAEAGMPLGGADFVLGVGYTRSNYRFKGSNIDDYAYTNSRLDIYLGAEFNFLETAVAMLGYSLRRDAETEAQPDVSGDPTTSAPIDYTHRIYAGVENSWDKAWIFDAFQLRGGAFYAITASGRKISDGSDNASNSMPAKHQRVVPTVGVGVSKSFATVDVFLNPGNWVGLFTGPEVLGATATVKF